MSVTAPTPQNYSHKPHILVVDDDKRIRDLVSRYLLDHDFVAVSAQDADEAEGMLARFTFDVLVVDVMMPGRSGLEFTRDLRQKSNIPVLLLTALGESQDRIAGLESGADDYLPKPFEPRELVLRLMSILKRSNKIMPGKTLYKVGHWFFDAEHDELRDGDDFVRLTSVETKLLRVMALRSGEVLSREELAALCGFDEAGERTIDVQVTRLRRKIEEDSKVPRILQTVRGKGYMLRAEKA